MQTYKELLTSKNPSILKDGTELSTFYTNMYLFIHWIVTKTNRQSGYVNDVARNYNNCNCIDVIQVLMRIINDNKLLLRLNDENIAKINDIYEHFNLILNNLDTYVRTNHRILYPDETDDVDERLNYDMIEYCNEKMAQFMSSNTIELDNEQKN